MKKIIAVIVLAMNLFFTQQIGAYNFIATTPEDVYEDYFGSMYNKTIFYNSGMLNTYSGADDYNNSWVFLLNRSGFISPLVAGNYYGIMIAFKDSYDEYWYVDFGEVFYYGYGYYYDCDLQTIIDDPWGTLEYDGIAVRHIVNDEVTGGSEEEEEPSGLIDLSGMYFDYPEFDWTDLRGVKLVIYQGNNNNQ